ncbi:hypothetical protein AMQ83_00445 [Paenibacillus riograndensis]|nr:hypothetical protein AMQ83_00445 [Paenibacillus riograndensis]
MLIGAGPAAAEPGAAGGFGARRGQPRRSAGPAAVTRGGAPAGKARASSAEREKNRKNKGAPKWLKDKTPRGEGQ